MDVDVDSGSPPRSESRGSSGHGHGHGHGHGRGLRRVLSLLAVVVGGASVLAGYVVFASASVRTADAVPGPLRRPAATAAAPPHLVQHPALGISAPTTDDLDRFIAATGTHPEVFNTFEPWSFDRPLQRGIADTVAARGARLMITWEPWDSTGHGVDQPAYSLASIIGGAHDAYIDLYAASIKRYPHPVTIRLMHEMNGGWYPWGSGVNGNQPGQYVLAWRHVHDRFAALGVTNVDWMWAPNAVYTGSAPLGPLYPGDADVDSVGISGYNWGEQPHDRSATHWSTFDALFDESIAAVEAVTGRPLWIAEVGSSNSGGDKADWLAATLHELQGRPDVAGLVWFDHVDAARSVDWRIETEPRAADAWRAAFTSRRSTLPDDSDERNPR